MRRNNFDLIRLAAALQVLFIHASEHIGHVAPLWIEDLVGRFPGVPIFFVISGYLVSASFERSQSFAVYARARALRIYPALYVCFAVSLAMVVATGYLRTVSVPPATFAAWVAAQLSFLQFWRPAFLDGFATGTLNGSLWTIPVELQFYALVPLLAFALRGMRKPWIALGIAIALLALVNLYRYGAVVDASNGFGARLLKMSVAPYLYMFLLGTGWRTIVARWPALVEGKFLYWLAAYIAVSYALSVAGFRSVDNGIGLANVLVLSGLVISGAYSMPTLAERLLRRNDISYGIYVYHMPVANALIWWQVGNALERTLLMAFASIALAAASWLLVERPALSLKAGAHLKISNAASGQI